jgi:hypothetical protein
MGIIEIRGKEVMDRINLAQVGYKLGAISCEHGTKMLGFITCWKFLEPR